MSKRKQFKLAEIQKALEQEVITPAVIKNTLGETEFKKKVERLHLFKIFPIVAIHHKPRLPRTNQDLNCVLLFPTSAK